MSRLPKFADDVSNRPPAKDEFKLGPFGCFILGFVAGVAALLVFGDTNILRYYIITAFR